MKSVIISQKTTTARKQEKMIEETETGRTGAETRRTWWEPDRILFEEMNQLCFMTCRRAEKVWWIWESLSSEFGICCCVGSDIFPSGSHRSPVYGAGFPGTNQISSVVSLCSRETTTCDITTKTPYLLQHNQTFYGVIVFFFMEKQAQYCHN